LAKKYSNFESDIVFCFIDLQDFSLLVLKLRKQFEKSKETSLTSQPKNKRDEIEISSDFQCEIQKRQTNKPGEILLMSFGNKSKGLEYILLEHLRI
jgi:hypothetical protein